MALLNCPECGKEISSNAKTCPHCGCEVTMCPDCNAVFAQKPEVCPSCGHVFNNVIHNVEQSVQDEFGNYVQDELSAINVAGIIQTILNFIKLGILIAAVVIYATLPQDDPLEYLYALSHMKQVFHVLIILFCIVVFADEIITIFVNNDCNIVYKLAANKMTLLDIDGVKYCKEHQNTLNNIAKKTNEWNFILNAAYNQDDKSSNKYSTLLIIIGTLLTIIQVICFAIVAYQLIDTAVVCAVLEKNFNWIENINYVALIIHIVGVVAYNIAKKVIQKKYFKNLKKWSNSKTINLK